MILGAYGLRVKSLTHGIKAWVLAYGFHRSTSGLWPLIWPSPKMKIFPVLRWGFIFNSPESNYTDGLSRLVSPRGSHFTLATRILPSFHQMAWTSIHTVSKLLGHKHVVSKAHNKASHAKSQ